MFNIYRHKNHLTYLTQRIRTKYVDKKPTDTDIITQSHNDNILLSNTVKGEYIVDPIEFCDTYKDLVYVKSGNICSNIYGDNLAGFVEVDLNKNYYAELAQFSLVNNENGFIFYKDNKAVNTSNAVATSNTYFIKDDDYFYIPDKEIMFHLIKNYTKHTNRYGYNHIYDYTDNTSTYIDSYYAIKLYTDYRFPNKIFSIYLCPNASYTIGGYNIDNNGTKFSIFFQLTHTQAFGTGAVPNADAYINLIDNGDGTYDLKSYIFGTTLTKTVEITVKDVFNKHSITSPDEVKTTVNLPYVISKVVDFRHYNNMNPNNCLLMLYANSKYYYTMYNFTSSGLECDIKELGSYDCILTDNKYTYFNDKYNTNNVIVYAMNRTLKKLDIFVYNFDTNEYVLVEKHDVENVNDTIYFVMGITCNNFYTIDKNYDILYTSLKMYSNIYDVSVETNETEKNITITIKGFDNFKEEDKVIALKFYKGLYDLDYVNKTLQLDSGDSSVGTITITQIEDFNTKAIVSEEIYNTIVGEK